MALPAVAALCASHQAVLVGRPWAQDLLRGMPWQVEALPRGLRPAVRLLRRLRGDEAGRAVLFTNSFGSALQTWLAGLASTGYRGDWRSWLLSDPRSKRAGGHEVEVFWDLAASAGSPAAPAPRQLGLRLHDEHRRQAATALAGVGVQGRTPCSVRSPPAPPRAAPSSGPPFPCSPRGLLEQGCRWWPAQVPGRSRRRRRRCRERTC